MNQNDLMPVITLSLLVLFFITIHSKEKEEYEKEKEKEKEKEMAKKEIASTAQTFYENGKKYYLEGKYSNALEMWEKAANLGNDKALFSLGKMGYEGKGIPQNPSMALAMWEKAAELGNTDAQYNIGLLYYQGNDASGIHQNYENARKWWEIAAQNNNMQAQFNLGLMYFTGHGVPKNLQSAASWWEKAAEQGHPKAAQNVAALYSNEDGFSKNYTRARHFLEIAAGQGIADAQYHLAMMYFNGQGGAINISNAMDLLNKAAAQGHMEAIAMQKRKPNSENFSNTLLDNPEQPENIANADITSEIKKTVGPFINAPKSSLHISSIEAVDDVKLVILAILKGETPQYINTYDSSMFERERDGSASFRGPVYRITLSLTNGEEFDIFYGLITDDRQGMVMSMNQTAMDNMCAYTLKELAEKIPGLYDLNLFKGAPTRYTYYLEKGNGWYYITNNSGDDSFFIPLDYSDSKHGRRGSILPLLNRDDY